MDPRCPECGEWTAVSRIIEVLSIGRGTRLKVAQVVPPPYCPMCGHPWRREGLADEAQKVIDDAEE